MQESVALSLRAFRDEREFAPVRVDPESGTIEWPDGVDLCPDVLYSAVTGIPIPWAEPEASE